MEWGDNSSTSKFPLLFRPCVHESHNDSKGSTALYSLSSLVSPQVTSILLFFFGVIVGIPLTSAGILANILNIVVFSKQGFKDNINIALTSLTVSDLLLVFFALWQSLYMEPSFKSLTRPFSNSDFATITVAISRLYFSRVSSLLTVYIAMERCTSVLVPLQVKFIFTRKRLIGAVIGIYISNVLAFIPFYYTTRISRKFDPIGNRTYLGIVYTQEVGIVRDFGVTVTIVLMFSTFGIIAVCTVVLVWTLYKQSLWRGQSLTTTAVKQTTAGPPLKESGTEEINKKSRRDLKLKEGTSSGHNNTANENKGSGSSMSERDKRAARTVTFLAAMFVVCYIPSVVCQIVMMIVPDFSQRGRYAYAYFIFYLITFKAEAVCASANTLIYYKTSAKFKETMMGVLCQFRQKVTSP